MNEIRLLYRSHHHVCVCVISDGLKGSSGSSAVAAVSVSVRNIWHHRTVRPWGESSASPIMSSSLVKFSLSAFVILGSKLMICLLSKFWCLPNSVSCKVNGWDSRKNSLSSASVHFSYGGGSLLQHFLHSSLAFATGMPSAPFTWYHFRSGNKSLSFL